MQHAQLVIVATSPDCRSYRLMVDGRVVWSNRVHPCPACEADARERMAAWAAKHRYTVDERKEVVKQRKRA